MGVFKGQNLLKFPDRFKTDDDCNAYLALIKSRTTYKYLRYNHTACQVLKDLTRQYIICGHIESATANTLFYKVEFSVLKVFFICFEMSTLTKSRSANHLSASYGITETTARLFMHKIREAMASRRNHPMDVQVHVDKFVVGGKDEGKRKKQSLPYS
jgi:hypothetical protein